MQEGKFSRTAQRVAIRRAAHQLLDEPKVLDDPLALRIIGAQAGRHPGDPAKLAPGTLPMFKPTAKPLSAEAIGKYAIKFNWNDKHDLGLYSWKFLREVCPCEECKAAGFRHEV